MVLDTAIGAASTLFAAIAAWGSVRAIQMTRDAERERALRRLLEALVAIQDAADALTGPLIDTERAVARDRFVAAQRDLKLALATPVIVYTLTDVDQAQEDVEYLKRADPDMPPRELYFKAVDAYLLLSNMWFPPGRRRAQGRIR
jgi:hypothetical protein